MLNTDSRANLRSLFLPFFLAASLPLWTAAPAGAADREAFLAAREALADRDYPAAIRRLEAFRSEFPDSPLREEGEILLARAHQLAGDPERALAELRKLVEAQPQGRFAVKARLLMADAFLAQKRFADAAEIYRTRLEFVRGDAYRDRLASFYLEIADAAYAGKKVQDPSTLLPRQVLVRDYPTALEHYRKALEAMGDGRLRRERGDEIRYRTAESLLELKRAPEALDELARLLAVQALPPDLLGRALFALGRAKLAAGDRAGSREAYARLEAELADHPLAPRALFEIGSNELMHAADPAAGDAREKQASLQRALAAFERFLKKFPQHELATSAAFSAGQARAFAGDRAGAIAQFRELVRTSPRDERAAAAQLRIAEILREEASFDQAVAEWKKFLAAYPSDPRWSEAQEKIEQSLYEKGLHLLRKEKKPEAARRAWDEFLAERPASALAPEVYRRLYEMALETKDYPAALEALRTVAVKYPASPLAPSSQLLLARLLQGPLDRLEEAIREYEALLAKFPQAPEANAARTALAEMRSKRLVLSAPRVYHSGEPWTLAVETRNVQKLTFKAYRLNLEEYFRKSLAVERIEEVAVGVVEPTKVWEHEVGIDERIGYQPYRLFSSEKKLPLPQDEAGAYLVTAEEETLQAVVLAVRSDLAVVSKASPRQTFLWALNERTGEPWPGARVVLADGEGVFFEGKTGEDGVLSIEHDRPRPDARILLVAGSQPPAAGRQPPAVTEIHYATDRTTAPAEVAYGYTTKAHVTTDRPLYRPEQTVHFRAILRKVVEGRFQSSEGDRADVKVVNPLGVVVYQEDLAANEFGAVAGTVLLADEPPLGEYQIQVQYQGLGFEGKFRVEEYRKPEFEVTLDAERPTWLRGEDIRGTIRATYLFGGPVPRARVTWRVFEGPYAFDPSRYEEHRWFFAPREKKEKAVSRFRLVAEGNGETDAEGKLAFEFRPPPADGDRTYRVQIEAVDLSRVAVSGSEDVLATSQGIYVVARASKKVYRPGDPVAMSFRTVDAAGRAAEARGEVVLARRVPGEAPGQFFDKALETQPLDIAGGKGEAVVRPREPGEYRVIFRTRDRANNAVEGGVVVRVSGEEPDLAKEARLLFEKAVYHRGEEAKLFFNSPAPGRPALLTFEGDRVIAHRLLRNAGKSGEISVTMEPRFAPNITAALAVPGGSKLHTASDEAVVLEYLEVEVASDKPEYRPGETARLTITARDQGGRPQEAELSLAVIDAAILQLQGDLAEAVKPFFYDQRRAHTVGTGSSHSFRYQGVTTAKTAELLAEEERKKDEKAGEEAKAGGRDLGFAKAGAKAARPRAPAPAEPAKKPETRSGAGFGGRRLAGAPGGGSGGGGSERGRANDFSDAAGAEENAPAAAAELAFEAPEQQAPAEEAFTANFGLAFDARGLEGQAGGAQPAEPTIRRNFADTALWRSDVRTGKDGKAEVTLTVPDNLTTWRAALAGATRPAAGEMLAGDGSGTFRSKKGLLLRLQAPRFLTREDRATISTPIHNYLPEAVETTLELAGRDIEARSFSRTTLRVGAGDVASADWELSPRPVPRGVLTARALSSKESDALEVAIPVIPFGRLHRGGEGGVLSDEALSRFEVPAAPLEGTARVRVEISPRFDDDLRRAVLYLRTFPYGCVEQTVSGFAGLLALVEALDRLGTPDQDLRNLLRDLAPRRIVKVLNLQRPSGGWGWWGPSASAEAKEADRSDPRMTAIALEALERARLAGFRVQEDRLEKARARAAAFLKQADLETGSLLALALSLSSRAPAAELSRLQRARENGSGGAVATLGLAMAGAGLEREAAELARLLKSRAQDLVLGGKVVGKFIPARPREGTGPESAPGATFATARALQLLDRLEPEDPLAPLLNDGLLALRRGVHWQTTDATAAAVIALAGHAARGAREAADAEIEIELNGEVVRKLRVSPTRPRDETPFAEVPPEKLKVGANGLVLRKRGTGRLGYTVTWQFSTPAESIAEEGNLLKVRREYLAFVPPRPEAPTPAAPPAPAAGAEEPGIGTADPPSRIAGAEAAWLEAKEPPPAGFRIVEAGRRPSLKPKTIEKSVAGDKVRVVLTIEARGDLEYLLVEDPLPAGCEVIDDPERFEGTFDRHEVRDQRVAFFRSRVPRGTHQISYLLRATFPGRYRALPAMASLMYEPGIIGQSADNRLEIRRPEAREPEPPPELTADEKLYEIERAFREVAAGLDRQGRAAREAELRERYLAILSGYPLADPYHDLVLSRLAALELSIGPADRAVRGLEELRRRNPRLATAENDLWRAAAAYGTLREHPAEVALLREIFERRYRADRAVSDTFFALGQHLRAQLHGFEVLISYPDSARTIGDWLELARRYGALKIKEEDPRTHRPRERAMLAESAENLAGFLAHFPASAQAPEAQFTLVSAYEALGDDRAEEGEGERFLRRYPSSHLLDDALLKSLEAAFRRGEYQKVLREAPRLEGEFLAPDGKFARSEHADQGIYLKAKAHHARGEIPEAIAAYARIAERVPDAAEALSYLTARELIAPPLAAIPLEEKPELEIAYRNVTALSLRAYRVDLPVLFATRESLLEASAVKLTGIDPLRAWEEKLPGDHLPRKARLAIPATEKGAYLVVGRAGAAAPPGAPGVPPSGEGSVAVKEFSTVVLRTDLEIDTQRVNDKLRILVFRRAPGGQRVPAAGAYLRVRGGENRRAAGSADARGIFEAQIPEGGVRVLAELEGHFALYQERFGDEE